MAEGFFTSSEATLSVVYRSATHLWGAWNVDYVDGVEPEDFEHNRQLGYVGLVDSSSDELASRLWARADVSIDQNAGTSTVPETFRSASERLSGEVVFETELSGGELGGLVPNVDFDFGDEVGVVLASKVVYAPVTRIDFVTDLESGPQTVVGVGGGKLGDRRGLNAHNAELQAQLRAEAAEAARQAAEAKSVAREAVYHARDKGGVIERYVEKAREHVAASEAASQQSREHMVAAASSLSSAQMASSSAASSLAEVDRLSDGVNRDYRAIVDLHSDVLRKHQAVDEAHSDTLLKHQAAINQANRAQQEAQKAINSNSNAITRVGQLAANAQSSASSASRQASAALSSANSARESSSAAAASLTAFVNAETAYQRRVNEYMAKMDNWLKLTGTRVVSLSANSRRVENGVYFVETGRQTMLIRNDTGYAMDWEMSTAEGTATNITGRSDHGTIKAYDNHSQNYSGWAGVIKSMTVVMRVKAPRPTF